MKTSTSFVSYSCACSQTRSHNSVRVKTRLPHEHLQQRQLARRQLDFSPVAMHSMVYQLKREISDAQGERQHFRQTARQCAYACDQFRHGKWIGQTIYWGVNLAGGFAEKNL